MFENQKLPIFFHLFHFFCVFEFEKKIKRSLFQPIQRLEIPKFSWPLGPNHGGASLDTEQRPPGSRAGYGLALGLFYRLGLSLHNPYSTLPSLVSWPFAVAQKKFGSRGYWYSPIKGSVTKFRCLLAKSERRLILLITDSRFISNTHGRRRWWGWGAVVLLPLFLLSKNKRKEKKFCWKSQRRNK